MKSVPIPRDVLGKVASGEIGKTAFWVYARLAEESLFHGDGFQPGLSSVEMSIEDISVSSGVGSTQVKLATRQLIQAGLLNRKRRTGQSNFYTFV